MEVKSLAVAGIPLPGMSYRLSQLSHSTLPSRGCRTKARAFNVRESSKANAGMHVQETMGTISK